MRINYRRRFLLVILLCLSFVPIISGEAAPSTHNVSTKTRARNVLDQLTPEERVGQLFLVSFQGTNVGIETQIHDLITNHHIGGVMLSAGNNNFTASDQTITNTWTLTNQLQTHRYSASQASSVDSDTEEVASQPTYIPLFIGISQEGDSAPHDQIINELTPLPSQLAIGATWNPELAKQVGTIAGNELAALGINLLFGPSLDVTENPRPEEEGDLNVRVFGGDPFWVGEMGRAYINGVHEGSQGHIAVVGTHFPGLGSADRLPTNEVATVRKSIEQLKQIELAPFFAVTGDAATESERIDALLVSHIRYQGLQGNIRSTTRPISFDQQALNLLMQLPSLSTWREDGGVMISDDLGSRAVRRFYDPTEQTFNARRLALDAFLAGNDLLYLNNFIGDNDPDAYTTIAKTLDFFTQKYHEDPVFAQRVDESAMRILTLKLRMFDSFTLNQVITSGNLDSVKTTESEQITYKIAQRGATLISPSLNELGDVMPNPPDYYDHIVFITDSYTAQQCAECPTQTIPPTNALEQSVLALYGPSSGRQISPNYLTSYSSTQLTQVLDNIEDTQTIEETLQRADWLVFTILDIQTDRPSSLALQRLLAERPDLSHNKKIIVFAANAPYYLDATNISKFTSYFGIYSKTSPFMDVAARLLFKEITTPEGDLPISVPGVGYVLMSATSPNPEQIIPLIVEFPNVTENISSPEVIIAPDFQIGKTITLKTGVILDHNNHPVPDNTPAQFIVTVNGQEMPTITTTTTDGIVHIDYKIGQPGFTNIKVKSGSAISDEITFEVPIGENTPIPPTVTPTQTPTASPSPTMPPPTPQPTPELEDTVQHPEIQDWLLALVIISIIAWAAARTGALMGQVRWGARWGLSAVIAGLLTYTFATLSLAGTTWAIETHQHWCVLLFAFLGALLGWGLSLLLYFKDRN
ncbi:MAG: glycoside hydrolase family 3 N-terminal domain-containing protein [Chloroflexota bacterium]|nr:glycoside hydrolase family 3 N-terminal domain-containing protein [Chloroflexota bacterium]